MILSFYLGIGVTSVFGYVKVILGGFGHESTTISSSFLLASIVLMILVTLALRVVASIPISLPANWIIRITQIRSAGDYQKAVRFSWCAVGVAPVLLIIAVFFAGSVSLAAGIRSFHYHAVPGNPAGGALSLYLP